MGDEPARRVPGASGSRSCRVATVSCPRARTVVVGALLVLGALAVDGLPAAAAPGRQRQAPGQVAGQLPPTVAAAQRDLDRATDELTAWEAAHGPDPAAVLADLDAQLADVEAQRLEPATVDERARLEFAFGALTAARADAAADLAAHDQLVDAERVARAGVVAAKLAAPAPTWSPAVTTPTGSSAPTEAPVEPPVRDDTWVVMALGAGLVVLAALAIVAVRHRRWRSQVFALEGAKVRGRRAERPVALEERVDVPVERPPRSRAWSRDRELP